MALTLLLLLLLGACRPLYFPLVPELERPEPRTRVQAELTLEAGRPQLELTLLQVAGEGWLALQWFAPNNREAASQSIWIAADSVGLTHVAALPQDVEVTAGEWRALLSQDGVVLRQLSVEAPGAAPGVATEQP